MERKYIGFTYVLWNCISGILSNLKLIYLLC